MNFERGIDPKGALQIGKVWKADRVDSIFIYIIYPEIPDKRRPFERFKQDPRTIKKARIKGKDVHQALQLMSEKKAPWDIVFEIFSEYKEKLTKGVFKLRFSVLFAKDEGKGHPSLSLRACMGRDLYYENILYEIPPKES